MLYLEQRQMRATRRIKKMQFVLFVLVLILALPLIIFAAPLVLYIGPLIIAALLISYALEERHIVKNNA